MKYCERTTSSHPVCASNSSVLRSIQDILNTEGYRQILFAEEIAINIDQLERQLCTRERRSANSTMDMTIGLSREGRIKNMLLVELKFNVTNPNNITKSEIDGKINYTTRLLSQEPPIYRKKILIFNDRVKRLATNSIARLYGNSPHQTVEVLSIQEFKQLYF